MMGATGDLPIGRRAFMAAGITTGIATTGLAAAMVAPSPAAAAITSTRSVVDFHNGGSDWTAAFQAAIDDANATNDRHGGGLVHVPAGRYVVAGNIRVHTGVTVQGEGWGSFIRLASQANAPIFSVDETTGADGKPAFATMICGLRLNGNGSQQAGSPPLIKIATGSATTPIFNDHRHTLADLYMQYGAGDGVAIEGTRATRVDNLYVTKCAGSGLSAIDASDGLFTRVVSAGNGVGFSLAGASNNLLACRASRNSADGFVITSSRSAVTNGYSLDNGRDGYRIQGNETNMTGCVADSNREAGVRISSARRVVVGGLSSFSRVPSDNGSSPFHQQWGVRFENTGDNFISGVVRQNQTGVDGSNSNGITQLVVV